jgi:hypothetical protein
LVSVIALVICAWAAQLGAQERELYDRDGAPIPLRGDAAILAALTDGDITSEETLGSGTTGVVRLEVEHAGATVRAVFRHVDEYEQNLRMRDGTSYVAFYDRFSGECAAYELALMLDVQMVPPAALRRVAGSRGSVQLWVEGAMTEGARNERGLEPPDTARWRRQQAIMRTFDALIANSDRNTGNSLIDADWNLWLIDHSRAFQVPRGDISFATVNQLPSDLWNALKALNHEDMRAVLRDYLDATQIRALENRHEALLAHIQDLIDTRGRGAVIIE